MNCDMRAKKNECMLRGGKCIGDHECDYAGEPPERYWEQRYQDVLKKLQASEERILAGVANASVDCLKELQSLRAKVRVWNNTIGAMVREWSDKLNAGEELNIGPWMLKINDIDDEMSEAVGDDIHPAIDCDYEKLAGLDNM